MSKQFRVRSDSGNVQIAGRIWARGIQGNVCGQSRKGDQNLNDCGTEQKWNGSDTVVYTLVALLCGGLRVAQLSQPFRGPLDSHSAFSLSFVCMASVAECLRIRFNVVCATVLQRHDMIALKRRWQQRLARFATPTRPGTDETFVVCGPGPP
jgi:hypothetical protein